MSIRFHTSIEPIPDEFRKKDTVKHFRLLAVIYPACDGRSSHGVYGQVLFENSELTPVSVSKLHNSIESIDSLKYGQGFSGIGRSFSSGVLKQFQNEHCVGMARVTAVSSEKQRTTYARHLYRLVQLNDSEQA